MDTSPSPCVGSTNVQEDLLKMHQLLLVDCPRLETDNKKSSKYSIKRNNSIIKLEVL